MSFSFHSHHRSPFCPSLRVPPHGLLLFNLFSSTISRPGMPQAAGLWRHSYRPCLIPVIPYGWCVCRTIVLFSMVRFAHNRATPRSRRRFDLFFLFVMMSLSLDLFEALPKVLLAWIEAAKHSPFVMVFEHNHWNCRLNCITYMLFFNVFSFPSPTKGCDFIS